MDGLVEQLVVKRKTMKDTLIQIGIIIVAFILIFISGSFLGGIPLVGIAVPAAIIYFAYRFVMAQNLEFEYALFNGEMDVDKIIAKRKRKRLFSVDIRKLDIVAPVSDENHKRELLIQGIQKRYSVASSPDSEGAYFANFNNNGVRTQMIFEPSEKMLNEIKRFIPRKVYMSKTTSQ